MRPADDASSFIEYRHEVAARDLGFLQHRLNSSGGRLAFTLGQQAITEIQVRFILAASYAGLIELRVDEDGLRAALNENAEEMEQEMKEISLE